MSEYESGAYTGEISADMLQSIEADGSIIGHSERNTISWRNRFSLQQKSEIGFR